MKYFVGYSKGVQTATFSDCWGFHIGKENNVPRHLAIRIMDCRALSSCALYVVAKCDLTIRLAMIDSTCLEGSSTTPTGRADLLKSWRKGIDRYRQPRHTHDLQMRRGTHWSCQNDMGCYCRRIVIGRTSSSLEWMTCGVQRFAQVHQKYQMGLSPSVIIAWVLTILWFMLFRRNRDPFKVRFPTRTTTTGRSLIFCCRDEDTLERLTE